MKKFILFLLVVVGVASFASCTKSTDFVPEQKTNAKLYFRIESVSIDDSLDYSRVVVLIQ